MGCLGLMEGPTSISAPDPRMRLLLNEMLEVLVVGLLLALVANQVSPRGLSLRRDYFKAASRASHGGSATQREAPDGPATRIPGTVSAEEALRWFEDPGRLLGRVIFVDARKESAFREGHIPGAIAFDRFHPELTLPDVVLAATHAEMVIVYCLGGACEDSHHAADQLVEAGLDRAKVLVYAGGISEWTRRGWPTERGDRGVGAPHASPP
jgi:rhodanese-related sulfurtransferase